MIRDFPFISLDRAGLQRPYLPVWVINPTTNLRHKVFALIDTGADECALPAGYAAILGHNLQKGEVRRLGTGNGFTMAYAHTVCIEVQSFATREVKIDFMPNLTTPLLGVKSFLSNFILKIDYPEKRFSLELPQ